MFIKQRTVSSSILGSKLLHLKYITEKDLWVDGLEEMGSLWELRSCSDCGVSDALILSDALKPLGSLRSLWGPGGGSVGMKQGCNFQEVCMLTASHCDSRLVRSVSSPWSTNHHRIQLESGKSLLVLRLILRLDSRVQNLWITFLTCSTHSTTFNRPPASASTFNSCPVTLSCAITSCTIVRGYSTGSIWCGVGGSFWALVRQVGLLPYICYSRSSLGWPGLVVSSCSSSVRLRIDSCRIDSCRLGSLLVSEVGEGLL